jgi:hypothetical protein
VVDRLQRWVLLYPKISRLQALRLCHLSYSYNTSMEHGTGFGSVIKDVDVLVRWQ